jgi:hypothetical protein
VLLARRLALSPLQRDIQWTQQEAGGEVMGAVTATVTALAQVEFRRALHERIKLGLVGMEGSTTHRRGEFVVTETGTDTEACRK